MRSNDRAFPYSASAIEQNPLGRPQLVCSALGLSLHHIEASRVHGRPLRDDDVATPFRL